MTSRLAEMVNQRPTFLLGHVKLLCKTGNAEKFGRSAIDELFCKTDIVTANILMAAYAFSVQRICTSGKDSREPQAKRCGPRFQG